jgi:hypothetical protein
MMLDLTDEETDALARNAAEIHGFCAAVPKFESISLQRRV